MNKRKWVLVLLTFALILSASIQPAMAYFTTFVRAKGGHPVSMGDTTTIEETFKDWTKTVVIRNKEGSEPVFIRAKVIYTDLSNKLGFTVAGTGWTALQADGYYYYSSKEPETSEITILNDVNDIKKGERKVNAMTGLTALEGGQPTDPLIVTITNIPEDPEKGDTFSVTVLYESTPVRYQENGTAYANWDATIQRVSSTTGGNG